MTTVEYLSHLVMFFREGNLQWLPVWSLWLTADPKQPPEFEKWVSISCKQKAALMSDCIWWMVHIVASLFLVEDVNVQSGAHKTSSLSWWYLAF